eukprot:6202242-Pleurochrysis_carterae.AAC.1
MGSKLPSLHFAVHERYFSNAASVETQRKSRREAGVRSKTQEPQLQSTRTYWMGTAVGTAVCRRTLENTWDPAGKTRTQTNLSHLELLFPSQQKAPTKQLPTFLERAEYNSQIEIRNKLARR